MQKAVFLDRDGVITEINTNRVYRINSPDNVFLLPGVAEAIRSLNDNGFNVFIVTNQGGIGLGYLGEEVLARIHLKLQALLLGEADAMIDDIVYCGDKPHDTGDPNKPQDEGSCRKPLPAMILDLAERHQIDLARSYTIGDMRSDIMAGNSAGTRTILILEKDEVIPVIEEAYAAVSLKDAVKQIIEMDPLDLTPINQG